MHAVQAGTWQHINSRYRKRHIEHGSDQPQEEGGEGEGQGGREDSLEPGSGMMVSDEGGGGDGGEEGVEGALVGEDVGGGKCEFEEDVGREVDGTKANGGGREGGRGRRKEGGVEEDVAGGKAGEGDERGGGREGG
ncbi:hypothetical protein VYU27_009198 [Nannochloropsis oceanica]